MAHCQKIEQSKQRGNQTKLICPLLGCSEYVCSPLNFQITWLIVFIFLSVFRSVRVFPLWTIPPALSTMRLKWRHSCSIYCSSSCHVIHRMLRRNFTFLAFRTAASMCRPSQATFWTSRATRWTCAASGSVPALLIQSIRCEVRFKFCCAISNTAFIS